MRAIYCETLPTGETVLVAQVGAYARLCVCVCARACARASVRASVRVHMRAHTRAAHVVSGHESVRQSMQTHLCACVRACVLARDCVGVHGVFAWYVRVYMRLCVHFCLCVVAFLCCWPH